VSQLTLDFDALPDTDEMIIVEDCRDRKHPLLTQWRTLSSE
jgi:hypothetical protein